MRNHTKILKNITEVAREKSSSFAIDEMQHILKQIDEEKNREVT